MNRIWYVRVNLFVFLTVMVLSLAISVRAQTPTPSATRDDIVRQVQGYAERHVKNDNPLQTQLVVDLFRDNPVGLLPQEIAQIYEEEYTRLKEAQKPGPWEQIRPSAGWIVAIILLVAAIFRDVATKWLTAVVESIGNWFYQRWASSRLLHGVALRKYRNALVKKYHLLPITFRPERPLKMHEVYIPLQVAGANDPAQLDAYRALAESHRLVVVGPPGSGKSMLLKHIALAYAEGRLLGLRGRPIPLLLELHRLNDPQLGVQEHLVSELARNSFPKAHGFVARNLKQGAFLLLLDGLDEVKSGERPRVVQTLRDFLDTYKQCRVIITCRKAVYKSEFADLVDRTLEVAEFTDQQILTFFRTWEPGMRSRGKSTEQLMRNLRERPRIMALARNPLLLTIIAYLYTDTEFVLPNSRAEFYRKATDILLDLWHSEKALNRYRASDKRLVLQHLALFNQEIASKQGEDSLSIELPTVLQEVGKVLPDLNLQPDDDARPILDEIVERSGLLLAVDGGERYQFAHLTLQEFFAAAELRNAPDKLMNHFAADRDTWRETVKLWCGQNVDSTGVIQQVYALDPLTAFECLGDAQKVDQATADDIINAFKAQLGADAQNDAVVRAFAVVASDSRPRGVAIFKFLEERLATAPDHNYKVAVANALALTNLPQAAAVLTRHVANNEHVHRALLRMGDLAVPTLVEAANAGRIDVFDHLLAIGTPQAALALLPFLYITDERNVGSSPSLAGIANFAAAWRLAGLLSQPAVEAELRQCLLSDQQKRLDQLDWVWQPFNEPSNSSLPAIAGRIAYLLDQSPPKHIPPTRLPLDPRLVIPLCAIRADPDRIKKVSGELKKSSSDLWQTLLPMVDTAPIQEKKQTPEPARQRARATQDETEREATVQHLWEKLITAQFTPHWRYLFSCLSLNLQIDLMGRLIKGPLPTPRDWVNLYQKAQYEFGTGWHWRAIRVILAVSTLLALYQMGLSLNAPVVTVFTWVLVPVAALLILLSWVTIFLIFLEPTRFSTLLVALGASWAVGTSAVSTVSIGVSLLANILKETQKLKLSMEEGGTEHGND